MRKLEVFFDYACPYCLRVHDDLLEALALHPDIRVEWRVCEAHPRPEIYERHSDLLARGMFFARECGADLHAYHRCVYHAAIVLRVNIDDPQIVADAVEGIVDRASLLKALSEDLYESELRENNRLAWQEYDFEAVPSYRLDGKLLKSAPGIGVSGRQIEEFLNGCLD